MLPSGRWKLTITARSAADKPTTTSRTVTVAFAGVSVVVKLEGGEALLKAWVDGKVDKRTGDSGKLYADGKSVTFTGDTSVEIRSSDPSVTYITVNGKDRGAMSTSTAPQTWLYTAKGPPKRTKHE